MVKTFKNHFIKIFLLENQWLEFLKALNFMDRMSVAIATERHVGLDLLFFFFSQDGV